MTSKQRAYLKSLASRNGPDDCRADKITGGTGDRQKNSSL